MKQEEIEEIFEDESIITDLPYSVFLGLEVLRKHIHNADIAAAEHDIIYSTVDLEMAEYVNIPKEDIIQLRRMNWIINQDCFAAFV